MPGYSSKLNLNEFLNAELQCNVDTTRANSVERLAMKPAGSCVIVSCQPNIGCGYFQAMHVRYAIDM